MTATIAIRAAIIWFAIALLAIANGALRDFILAPFMGSEAALPLSGIMLSLIVLLVTTLAHRFIGAQTRSARWLVGVQWVAMTLLFEFAFGHYVAGKPWGTLLETFNVLTGDLFLLVLLVSLIAPSLVARLKDSTGK